MASPLPTWEHYSGECFSFKVNPRTLQSNTPSSVFQFLCKLPKLAPSSKPKTPFNPATTHPQSKFKSAFRNQARKTTGIVPYRQRREREREQEQLSASAGAGKGVAVDSARGGPESGSVTKRVKRSREEGRKGRSQSPSPHGRSKSIPIPSPLVPPPSLPLLSHGSTKANAISIDSNSNPSSDSDLESFALAGKLNGPGPAPVSRLSGVARAHRGSRTRQQVSGVAQLTRDSRLISDLPLSGQDTINSKDSDAEDEDSRMIIDSPVFSTGTINEGVQSPAFLKLNSKPKSTLKPRLPQIAIRTKPKPKPASTSNKPSSTTPATPAGAAAVVIPEPTIISSDSEPGKSRLLEDEGEEMIHGPPLTPLLHSHSPQNANPKLQIQGVKPQPRLKPNEKAKPKDRGEPEDDKKWLQSLTEAFDISGQANFPIPTSGKGKRKGDDKGKGKERKGRNTDRGIGALSDSFTPLPGSKAYLHALTQSQNARQPKLNPLTQRPPVQNSQTQTAQRVPPTRPTHRLSLAQTNPLVQKGFFLNDDPSERPSSPSFPSSFSLSPSSSVPPPSSLPERAHNQNPKIPSFSSSPSSPSSSSSSSSSSEIQSTPVLPSQQRAERKRKEKEKTLELLNILGRQNQSQIPGGSQNLNLSQTQIQQETQDDPTLFPPLDYVDCDRLYDEQPPPLPLRQKQSPLPPPPLIQFRTPLKTITQLWTNPELLSGRRLVRFIVSREERVSGRSGNEHNNGVHDRDRARGGDKDPSPVVVVVVKWELIYQFYNEKKGRVDYDGFDAEHEHDENGVDEAKRDVDQKEDNDEKKKGIIISCIRHPKTSSYHVTFSDLVRLVQYIVFSTTSTNTSTTSITTPTSNSTRTTIRTLLSNHTNQVQVQNLPPNSNGDHNNFTSPIMDYPNHNPMNSDSNPNNLQLFNWETLPQIVIKVFSKYHASLYTSLSSTTSPLLLPPLPVDGTNLTTDPMHVSTIQQAQGTQNARESQHARDAKAVQQDSTEPIEAMKAVEPMDMEIVGPTEVIEAKKPVQTMRDESMEQAKNTLLVVSSRFIPSNVSFDVDSGEDSEMHVINMVDVRNDPDLSISPVEIQAQGIQEGVPGGVEEEGVEVEGVEGIPFQHKPRYRNRRIITSAEPIAEVLKTERELTRRSIQSHSPSSSEEDSNLPLLPRRSSRSQRTAQQPQQTSRPSRSRSNRAISIGYSSGSGSDSYYEISALGLGSSSSESSNAGVDDGTPPRSTTPEDLVEPLNITNRLKPKPKPKSLPSPQPPFPLLTLAGFPVTTWTQTRLQLQSTPPPHRYSKSLSHIMHDYINSYNPQMRNYPQMRIVYESMMKENTSLDEPDAPEIRIYGNEDSGFSHYTYNDNNVENNTDIDTPEPTPPWEFYYTNEMLLGNGVSPPSRLNLKGCDCEGGQCHLNTGKTKNNSRKPCSCLQKQEDHTKIYDVHGFMYNQDGLLKKNGLPVFECNSLCGCGEECRNRVVGQGRKCKVMLKKTPKKGWGVFACEKIPEGTFIGIYSGELLGHEESEERAIKYDEFGRTYLFDIDWWYINAELDAKEAKEAKEARAKAEEELDEREKDKAKDEDKDKRESARGREELDEKVSDRKPQHTALENEEDRTDIVLTDAFGVPIDDAILAGSSGAGSGTYPAQRSGKSGKRGKGSKGRAPNSDSSESDSSASSSNSDSEEETRRPSKYTIDAYHAGNFTRFLNHSCDPNAALTPVYIDVDEIERPLLTIFSKREIQDQEEITFSYSGDPDVDDDDIDIEEEINITTTASRPTTTLPKRRKSARLKHNKPLPESPKRGKKGDARVHVDCECGAANCKGTIWRQ